MRICLEVGEVERHHVEFTFNQLLGLLEIRVNKKAIKKQVRWFNEPMAETHTIQVGDGERVVVRFEKERASTFTQKCRVFLNERLFKCYEGA